MVKTIVCALFMSCFTRMFIQNLLFFVIVIFLCVCMVSESRCFKNPYLILHWLRIIGHTYPITDNIGIKKLCSGFWGNIFQWYGILLKLKNEPHYLQTGLDNFLFQLSFSKILTCDINLCYSVPHTSQSSHPPRAAPVAPVSKAKNK